MNTRGNAATALLVAVILFSGIVAFLLKVGEADAQAVERVQSRWLYRQESPNAIEVVEDRANGVACYVYASYGISCVKVR